MQAYPLDDLILYGNVLNRLFQIQKERCSICCTGLSTSLPGGHSELEPPDPIPNSEVKRLSADGSVGLPHVRVGHCQALNPKPQIEFSVWGFSFAA